MDELESLKKARERIMELSGKTVRELGYELTVEEEIFKDGISGLVAVVSGDFSGITKAEIEILNRDIPESITINNHVYGVPNPTFPVKKGYRYIK